MKNENLQKESLVLELIQENFLDRIEEKTPGVKASLVLSDIVAFGEEESMFKSVTLSTEDEKHVVTYFNNEDADEETQKMVLYADKSDKELKVYVMSVDKTIPLELDENVTPAAVSFCLAGYKHCGPDCGDQGSKGGGTPVNDLDICCRTHDRCWKNFGKYNCDCDRTVVACATVQAYKGNNRAAAATVIGWFTTGGQVVCK